MRFLLCLGVQPIICPPQRPDLNAFVERYPRSLKQECLLVTRPHTLEAVREAGAGVCAALPPGATQSGTHLRESSASCRFSLPSCFATDPRLGRSRCLAPPRAWAAFHSASVRHNGTVVLDDVASYVQQALVGQYVDLCVNAVQQELIVWHQQQPLKRIPIKGLYKALLSFEECVAVMEQQALTEQRRLLQARRRASTDAA